MMKKIIWIMALMVAGVISIQAQTCASGDCECASCLAKKEGTFTLSGLEGLNDSDEHAEHAEDQHDDHDHAAEVVSHDKTGVSDHEVDPDANLHEGHDHASVDEHADHDDHAEHAEGIEISKEAIAKIGLQIRAAEGGSVARASVFPAEIKLNRDRTATVSPRYASIVRQVFGEIGDTVRKGDVLASLENRETMAVYAVSAPLDGIIISKDLAVGETADADKMLFEVADLSSVWADISIFPQYQHVLSKGMSVTFMAHDGHTTEGTVKYISPIISHETRTFTARCVLEGADEDFTPGAFVRARIHIETVNASVIVPRDAIQMLEGEPVVFVPDEHGFITIPVEPGLADENHVEIKQGLEPGDHYVAAGAFALKAQMVTSGMDPHAGHGH